MLGAFIARIRNRNEAAARLERWTKRTNRPEVSPERMNENMELDLRETSPQLRHMGPITR